MTESTETLIRYRLERANEALAEARLLASSGHWNTCANRLYYACFYAVTALQLSRGVSFSKHSAVRAAFNREFVKSGLVSKVFGGLYNDLYESRLEGDYQDLVRLNPSLVEPWIPQARAFIEAISQLALQE